MNSHLLPFCDVETYDSQPFDPSGKVCTQDLAQNECYLRLCVNPGDDFLVTCFNWQSFSFIFQSLPAFKSPCCQARILCTPFFKSAFFCPFGGSPQTI